MLEDELCIYGSLKIPNNFPIYELNLTSPSPQDHNLPSHNALWKSFKEMPSFISYYINFTK